MALTRLLPTTIDDNRMISSSETGVIVKDVVPHSMSDDIDDCCLCTCACCPTVSNWCIKDAFGISCSFVTWFLFLYAQFVIVFVILIPKDYSILVYLIHLFTFHCLEFLAIASHCRTMFSDPGAVPLNNATPEKLLTYENGTVVYRCAMCQSIKPPRAHHCRICKRCIQRMDHHCVFVNNCVGESNQKYFILFTFYTCLVSIYGLVLLCIHMTTCITSNWTACPTWSPPITLVFVIFLGLEAFTFSIFTAVMFCSQLHSIYTDTTGIEHYKGKRSSNYDQSSFLSSLKTVFGSQVGLTWLNPFSKPKFIKSQNDEHITFDI